MHGTMQADARKTVTVVSVVRNEADILPAFLSHYRSLGVRHFLMIDNESNDDTADLLRAQPDVVLFQATGSYQQAYCGVAWSNSVAGTFCNGNWVLVADADEFLLPPAGIDDLQQLVARLEREAALGLYCAVVDFFSKDLSQEHVPDWAGLDHLLQEAPWFTPFDATYLKRREHFPHADIELGNHGIRAALSKGRYIPRLNNMPLVFWRPGFHFTRSTHEGTWLPLSDLVGVFCHFKFRPGFATRVRRRLRTDNRQNIQALSAYVSAAKNLPADHPALSNARKFRHKDDLVEAGWLADVRELPENTIPQQSLARLWPKMNDSRKDLFRLLVKSDSSICIRGEDQMLQCKAQALLRQVLASPSARMTLPLRRVLMKHSLIRPEYVPEESLSIERDTVEVLQQFLNSWWWDVGWPLRLPHHLRMAVRWRRLWQLLHSVKWRHEEKK